MNFKITNILFVFLLLSACSTDLSKPDTTDTNTTTTEPPVFVTGNGATYYISNSGDVYRGYPQIFGGSETAWTRYGSYGEGEKPKIIGSVDVGEAELWVNVNQANIWHSTIQSETYEVGALYLGGEIFGSKKKGRRRVGWYGVGV